MPKLKSPKAKGDTFERDLASYFNTTHGLRSHRTPLSGGGLGFAYNTAPSADLTGTPMIAVEAKRTERLNIHDAMAQAIKTSAAHSNADLPIVITRRNHQLLSDSLVIMRLKDFSIFYSALLHKHGYNFLLPPSQPEPGDQQ